MLSSKYTYIINSNYSLNSIDYRLLNAMGIDTYYHPIGEESNRKI